MSWPTWYIDMGRPIAWKMCKGSNPAFMLWRIWHWLISWLWLKNIENSISVLSLPLVKVNSTSTFWWKYYGSIEKIGVHMHHITWIKGEKRGARAKKGCATQQGVVFTSLSLEQGLQIAISVCWNRIHTFHPFQLWNWVYFFPARIKG